MVPRAPCYQHRTVIATPDEMKNLLIHAAPWMRCFVLLCSQLGLRFSEAASVSPACWKPDQHTILVMTKGGKPRLLPTTKEMEELFTIAARHPDEDTPFIWLLLNKPSTCGPNKGAIERDARTFIDKHWRNLKARAGVNPDLNIHDLRRTRITEVYRQTLDVKLAQQFAGHTHIAATAYYLAPWDENKVLDAIAKTAPPGGWKPKAVN